MILAERFAPHLHYGSSCLFLENGNAVLEAFHLLGGIANWLAIGQFIRDGGLSPPPVTMTPKMAALTVRVAPRRQQPEAAEQVGQAASEDTASYQAPAAEF
ncbi:MAG TPA: hypothetical protein VIE66_17955 [Methylocella sp.]